MVLLLIASTADAQSIFTERGFSLTRDSFSPLPYEHIDPLTGNLLLTFTDLVLPGPAGFDLVIQRSYNSKIYQGYPNGTGLVSEDSWAGVGWSLHFGRLWGYSTQSPFFETPDGGRRQFFPKVTEPLGAATMFVTRDFWEYDSVTRKVKLPNGRVHTLGAVPANLSGGQARLVERTEDPFGNRIDIVYEVFNEVVQTVTQTMGVQSRVVSFQRNIATGALTGMTYGALHWTYAQVPLAGQPTFTLLTSVQPPQGAPWAYQYTTVNPMHMLRKITTPNGGSLDYSYQEFKSRLGSTAEVKFLGIRTRVTSGRAVQGGTWTLSYAQGSGLNETYVDEPGGRRLVERFFGVGSSIWTGIPGWKIGLPDLRQVKAGATLVKSETMVWRSPLDGEQVSNVFEALGNANTFIYLQLLQSRTVTLGSSSFITDYTYHGASTFNDYGRPYQTQEHQVVSGVSGPTRTTTQTFTYGFTPYIVDRLGSETVSVTNGSATENGTFATRGYLWDLFTGFRASETVLGTTTTYAKTSLGDVLRRTDALGHQTTYSYDWGVLKNITPPVSGTQTTRVVNSSGTVASETRRGFQTTYVYDGLFRPTVVDPPLGNNTVTTYDASGTFIQATRGPNVNNFQTWVKTTLDGFGRSILTENAAGVTAKTTYDPLGRVVFQSLPYKAPALGTIGTTFVYDALDRLITKTNPDGSAASRVYDGISVTITDELSHKTRQVWQAFGDPSQARLTSVTLDYQGGGGVGNSLQQTTAYTYNALDSLRTVTFLGSSGVARTFVYNAKNQLESEQHPELSNSVAYVYDAAGNLKTRADPNGTTTFFYDSNDRLTRVDRPGSLDDVDPITYDFSDNRTGFTTGALGSGLSPRIVALMQYDGNNRPMYRTDTIDGTAFTTSFSYDGNDNLQRITYPTGVVAQYEYDAANRVAAVKNLAGTYFYASNLQYHPSGALSSFKPGGTLPVQTFTYDSLTYRPRTVATGAFSSTYAYDVLGNVTGSTQALLLSGQPIPCGSSQNLTQCFSYDRLDRLEAITHGPGVGGFTYTPNGDRLQQTTLGSTATYTYNSSTLRLATIDGQGVTHDGSGNLMQGPGGSNTYTPENMMRTATTPAGSTTYWYDADNLRKGKVNSPTGGSVEKSLYVHGLSNELLAEYKANCAGGTLAPTRSYIYAGGRLIAAVRPTTVPISVAFATTAQTVLESAGTVTTSVRLTTGNGQGIACPVAVSYSTVSGTAVAGSDFVATTQTITFPIGSGSGAGTLLPAIVTILNDTLDEDLETFTIALIPVADVNVSAIAHQVSIADDDPPPALSISDVSIQEGNIGTTTAVFAVTLTTASGKPVSVGWSTAPGTAAAAVDFISASGTLNFAAGQTSQPVSVAVVGDSSYEPDQTFFVNLSGAVNATVSKAQGVGTILDDDPPPTISIADSAVIEHNSGLHPWQFTVTLSASSDFAVAVNYVTTNLTADGGDHQMPASGTINFPPGSASQVVDGTVVGDADPEENETIQVDLSGAFNGTIGIGQATGTILDDEATNYFTVTPCRLLDTRLTGPGALAAGSTRLVPGAGLCGIPSTAKSIAIVVTAVTPTGAGFLALFPSHSTPPGTSTINFKSGVTRSNNAIVVLGGGSQVSVKCGMALGTTHVVIDVFGYFGYPQ